MRRLACIAALALTACPIHLRRNAPGHAGLSTPPRDMTRRAVETPADPGETVLMVNAGGFTGGGARFLQARSSDVDGVFEAGVEVGAHWSCEEQSHQKPDMFTFLPHPIPLDTHGFNIGGSFTGEDDLRFSNLYAEYSRGRGIWGWGAGWSVDPEEWTHGPHAQVYVTYIYMRGSWQIDRGGEVMAGVFLKIPAIFTWSR